MKWKLYYSDGSTYKGENAEQAYRAKGRTEKGQLVVLVKQEADNERGYSIRHGSDFFVWEDDPVERWGGKDREGLMDYFLHKEGYQKVMPGREIHDGLFQLILRDANRDGCLCDQPCEKHQK